MRKPFQYQRCSTFELLLGQLSKVQRVGNGWRADCPAHDDSAAMLSISKSSPDHLVLNCLEGCTQSAVLRSVGFHEPEGGA